tara:strand:- start:136 stop:471 length:336 start_codon:yes stop_codon:yes gene_type:complete
MKYFAKLGLNSKVVMVTHVGDDDAPTEEKGIEYLNRLHLHPFWAETFKDGSQRKNFAGKGHIYDEDRDAFIPRQPFSSWILDEDTCQWNPPTPYPDDGNKYRWNEEILGWS